MANDNANSLSGGPLFPAGTLVKFNRFRTEVGDRRMFTSVKHDNVSWKFVERSFKYYVEVSVDIDSTGVVIDSNVDFLRLNAYPDSGYYIVLFDEKLVAIHHGYMHYNLAPADASCVWFPLPLFRHCND